MKILITGASGVLGNAVYDAFRAHNPNPEDVLGLSFKQKKPGFKQVDLMNESDTEALFAEFEPNFVIHCAAERRPDVAQKDPDGIRKLNAELPARLTELAARSKATLVYISTDYVFDGTNPPYFPSSIPNPVQLYGETKLAGEESVLRSSSSNGLVLRVPVLYGPSPLNSDSAVNVLLDYVQDQTGKKYTMDHYCTRYPTNVLDIAKFLVKLADLSQSMKLPKISHFSAPEPFTKYEMCLILARILKVSHAHITPDSSEPKPGSTPRPRDCKLDTMETEKIFGGNLLDCVGFEEWWTTKLNG